MEMQSRRVLTKGTIFRKADLHIHTPASKCYKQDEKHIGASEIVSEAISKGLQIIAITDHNDIAFIDKVQTAAKGKGIFVFPGVEITAQEAHVLAIFDPDFPSEKLNELLIVVGITSDKRGQREAMAKSLEEVVREVDRLGGVAIAPHANSSNGLLKHPRGQYKIKMCQMPQLCALEFADQEDTEKFSKGGVPGYPPKACVCGSDAHCLAEIGNRYTHLKMDTVSIRGLRQALADYQVRIRFPWDTIELGYPQIRSLSVNQGFLGGETFELHPNLTCLIGGRGTGKSTVIEFMRYCFNDISTIGDIREDTYSKVEKLVGAGGKISVAYLDERGEELTIEREVSDPSLRGEVKQTVTDSSGDEAVLLNKPMFFSQGEISRIATNPIAQLELIDKYLDLSDENRQEEGLISSLKTNRSSLTELTRKLDELRSEIQDPQNGKLATQAEHDRLEKQLQNPIFSEFPKWESEKQFISDTISGLDNLQEAAQDAIESIDVSSSFPLPLEAGSPSPQLLSPLLQLPENLQKHLDSIKQALGAEISARKQQTNEVYDRWLPLFETKRREYYKFVSELGEESINIAQTRFRALKTRLRELRRKEAEAERCSRGIQDLQKERQTLLGQLREVRQRRFQRRVSKAKEWESKLSSRITIDIVSCGDREEYFARLRELVRGSHIYQKDLSRIVQSIDPDELVEASLSDQTEWLSTQSTVREDAITTMVSYFRTRDKEELLDLQGVELPDLPQIAFQLEPEKYKPLNELSVGTKSTVIMSLAMIEGNSPLVIDQPEDSLDTEFIYNEIVRRLRSEKDARQFILTSHNANVVVAGEAELTYVLSATADKGGIKSSGGIDRLETNQLVLLHLEGGSEAFNLRAQKYIG